MMTVLSNREIALDNEEVLKEAKMARYPKAQWIGCNPNNYSTDPIKHKFIVIHVTQGDNQSGTDSWFQNPQAIVSAHFSIGKDGAIHQYVDTDQMAYAEMAYNGESISIEHSGYTGDFLTPQQIASERELLLWIHQTHKIRLVHTTNPADPLGGVIGHGELGVPGGNHPLCPGAHILTDITRILSEPPLKPVTPPAPVNRPTLKLGSKGPQVVFLQRKLHIPANGTFNAQTEAAVKHFQTLHKLPVNGIVDAAVWRALGA